MKKSFTLFFVLVFISSLVFAKQVDEQTARSVGQHFLATRVANAVFKSQVSLERVSLSLPGDQQERPGYYIFNTAGQNGFVIIAADDAVKPVLAYSTERSFDPENLSPEVSYWLEGYRSQIQYAEEHNLAQTPSIRAAWADLTKPVKPAAKEFKVVSSFPLVQTQWDQSPNYNDMCPYDNQYNDRTVTGCVATGMAQVVKYWNSPATGSGFHSYNSQSYGTLSADFGSTTYQWNSMPNSISSANDAIATLMFQLGVSVDMSYGVGSQGGSAAYVVSSQSPIQNCAEYALKTYFGYTNCQGVVREGYSDNQWIALLKGELDNSRPILYAGFGSGGGHCFVCDGYDQNNMFHFNWGWSGAYDGYFEINSLNPGGVGTGGGTGGFNSGHQAVIGIQGSGGGGGGGTTNNMSLYANVSMANTTLTYGDAFTVHCDIANTGTTTFNGDYCAAIFDNNNVFVDYVQILTGASLQAGYHYTNGLDFTNNGLLTMLPGTYTIAIYYRPTGDNWYKVSDYQTYVNNLDVSVTWSNIVEMYSNINVSPGTTLTQNQNVSVNLDILNTGTNNFTGSVDVSLYNLDGSWAYEIQQIDGLNLPPNYHYTNGLTFSTASLNAEPGTYLMACLYTRNGSDWFLTGSSNYQNPIQVTVQAGVLNPDGFEPNNTVNQAYPFSLSFSGNQASVNTAGANINDGNDYDYYKINLQSGYTYSIYANLNDAGTEPQSYSLDAMFSYSFDGNTFSNPYDQSMVNSIVSQTGGTVYFMVSPKFTGSTGTYKLNINVEKNPQGVQNGDPFASVSIYPNPVRDKVNIDLSAYAGSFNRIELMNLVGQTLAEQNIPTDQKSITLNVPGLKDGTYMIRLLGDSGVCTRRIVIRN
jgi:hypothetical protein